MHCIKIIIPGNFQGIKWNIKIKCFIANDSCTSMKETIEYFLFTLVII